eukprot:3994273-Pleurochrysis_carterae.AAC.1
MEAQADAVRKLAATSSSGWTGARRHARAHCNACGHRHVHACSPRSACGILCCGLYKRVHTRGHLHGSWPRGTYPCCCDVDASRVYAASALASPRQQEAFALLA